MRLHRLLGTLALALAVSGFTTTIASAGPPPGKKVTMCHRTHGKDGTHLVTIQVAVSAVQAHVRNQGDLIGRCPTPPNASPAPSSPPAAPPPSDPATTASPPPAPAPAPQDAPVDHGNGKSNGSGDGNGNGNGNAKGHK
jgi:hypothetical protein